MSWKHIIPLSLLIGLISAYLVVNYSSIFMYPLPLWALVLGFFSQTRKLGLASGLVLFFAYTVTTTAVMRPAFLLNLPLYLYYYLFAFLYGGFLFPAIGFLASSAEKGLNVKAFAAVALTIIGVGLSFHLAAPESTYRVSIALSAPQQEFEYLEVYLPMPHLLGEPYEKLFEEAEFSYSKAALSIMEEWELKNYTLRVEETEHGDMLVLGLTSLPREQGPVYGGPSPGGYVYDGVVTLEQAAGYPVAAPPYEKTLKLHPRYSQRSITRKTGSAVRVEGVPPNVNVTTTEFPLPPSAWYKVTLFDVPVKMVSRPGASLKINMHLSSTDTRRITQGYAMVQSYSESFEITLEPGNEWAYVEAKAKTASDLRGFGD